MLHYLGFERKFYLSIWNSLPGKLLMTLLISMVPVIELRGALPIATANGLNFWAAIVVSKIFDWMKRHSKALGRLVARFEARAAKKSGTVEKYEFWGLVVLVAIPLPGTGAWTGALVAAMLDMRVRKAFPAIACGVLIAGAIVAFVTYGAGAIFF